MLPLIEPDGIVYGQATRDWCHGGSKALHPVVHLHIMDRNGNIFLQKRAPEKLLWPGRWDTAVGGHVTYGESVLESLYREAGEELGLERFTPAYIGTHIYDSGRERELSVIFAYIGHPAINPDNAEVSEGRWFTLAQIEASLRAGLFTPDFEEEFALVGADLLAML